MSRRQYRKVIDGLHGVTYYEVICPSCDRKWVQDTQHDCDTILRWYCDVCNNWVCNLCARLEPHKTAKGKHRVMLINRLSCRDACMNCITRVECSYIDELQLEDLPLLISWAWISDLARERLLQRLKEGR